MKQILKAMFTSPQTLDISQYLEGLYKISDELAGVDPGFSIGGGTNPLGGHVHMILPNFPDNCMKLRKVWAIGEGHMLGHTPKSANAG